MSTHNLSVTYAPKIQGVRDGTITQTIRCGQVRLKRVGDYLRIFTWTGKPYRSPQEVLCWGRVNWVDTVGIVSEGLQIACVGSVAYITVPWAMLDYLAKLDGIDPPTGTELGRVLTSKNKIPKEGIAGQIIRWEWLGPTKPILVH